MSSIVVFGGSGYIGSHIAEHWLATGLADEVVLADINSSPLLGVAKTGASRGSSVPSQTGLRFVRCDVRRPIPVDLCAQPPEWIFNLAAVHREPGHAPREYFETNLNGAENVTAYASAVGCNNLFFTSSISVYGPTIGATAEDAPKRPNSPYGASKFPAELIHQRWLAESSRRRLMIVRPGVVYGPSDPGNIGRMVKAIQKGYFAFPGSTDILKSYGYIYGLLESMEFVIASGERSVIYNYVETPTETLGEIAAHVKRFSRSQAPILSLPRTLLMPMAYSIQLILGDRNPVHPIRVRKAGMATHIVPAMLQKMGFSSGYTFANSLEHWRDKAPEDWQIGGD